MKTGYEDWDQNLKTLSQSLFPDPSLAARGYYYGTEARKGQLESNKIIDQQNWRNRYGMMTQGGPQPGPLTFQQPGNVPGAAPIAAPPANLPMAGAPAASLAAAVTNMTPGQAADMVPAAVAPYTQGTPPPASPPSAVSPPAPNTTTSNGQVPTNDPVSGVLNPGSTTDPNGGPKQAGPATSNGSVAPVPPGMTLPGLMAMHGAGALAGIDAATLAGGGQALAYELYSKGIIGLPQYKQMLAGTGQAGPLDADIAAAATVKGHEIAAGATIGAAKIREAGETGRKGMDLQAVVTDPNTGATVLRPLSQLQGIGGTPSFSPDAVKTGTTPITVQPGGPGTATYSMPTGRAQQPVPGAPGQPAQPGTPLYQQGTEDIRQTQLGAVHNWVDPKNPTQMIPGTVEEARQNGWTAPPTTLEGWNSLAASASANAPPDQAQQIRDKVLQFAATTTPKPVTAEETNREQRLLDNQLANHLPVPAGEFVKEPWWTNKMPAGSSPALGAVLSDLTDQYYRYDPETRGNQVTSANKAIKQLIEEKRINPAQGRTTGWISDDKTINKTVLTKDGPQQVQHFRVDLLDEAGKPIKEGQPVPRIMMRRLSNAVAPGGPTGPQPRGPAPLVTGRPPGGPAAAAPAAPAGAPAGAIGAARPGTPDGPATIGGKPVVVRGGYIFPG